MGVVFFPSLPFMGVMLFPSFTQGNASEGGGTFLVPPSLFFILLSLPLLSSPSSSFPLFFHISFSLFPFLPHKLFPFFFFFSSFPPISFPSLSFHSLFLPSFFFRVSFSLLLFLPHKLLPFFFCFFLRELLVL